MKNYGLKLSPVTQDQYIFGASPLSGMSDVLQSGDWRPYLPKFEPQVLPSGEEDYGCTVFGGTNQTEILLKLLTGIEHNFDEQFNYNIVEVEPPGADPQLFYESQRKQFLTEGILNKAQTLAEFKKPRPMTEEYLNEARKFGYIIGHEWLFTNNPTKEVRLNLLRTGLKKSPVAVSVSAWASDENSLYYNNGMANNHWCVGVAMEGDSLVVFDSYDQSIKKLHPDHRIQVAKIIYATKKSEVEEVKIGKMKQLINYLLQLVGLYEKQIEALPKPEPVNHYEEVKEAVKPKYLWDTKTNIKHSIRVICDELGFTLEQKNTMCATIQAESGFILTAKHVNPTSTDWGLCQWNDKYHGSEITPDESVNNPEKAVRLMCTYWKRGQRDLWIAYKNGSYKKYL